MDIIMVCIFGCLACLIFFFICYSVTTNKIIRGQEKEIETLQAQNKRMETALIKLRDIVKERRV